MTVLPLLFSLVLQQPAEAARLAASGESYLEAGQNERAAEAFTQALKLNPKEFAALSGMGFLHFSQGRLAEARTLLEQAVAVRPKSFQANFLLGATCVGLNDTARAIPRLEAAHAINPKHSDARKLLAAEYVRSRNFKRTVALLSPAVDLTPFDEETHLLLINALQGAEDNEGSFHLAQKAAEKFPHSAQVAAWLGFQYQFSGRWEEAKKELARSIQLDPGYGASYQMLADVHLKEENFPEALAWFQKAVGFMPDDAETLLGLSKALVETGDITQGIKVLQKAAQADPKDARVHLQLSRLYFQMGDEKRAQEEAALSVKLRPPAPSLVQPPTALRRIQ